MVIRTFFNKNNTIVRNDYSNTGRNPVAQLFYGGPSGQNTYSRYLFDFDKTRLINYYTGIESTQSQRMRCNQCIQFL